MRRDGKEILERMLFMETHGFSELMTPFFLELVMGQSFCGWSVEKQCCTFTPSLFQLPRLRFVHSFFYFQELEGIVQVFFDGKCCRAVAYRLHIICSRKKV